MKSSEQIKEDKDIFPGLNKGLTKCLTDIVFEVNPERTHISTYEVTLPFTHVQDINDGDASVDDALDVYHLFLSELFPAIISAAKEETLKAGAKFTCEPDEIMTLYEEKALEFIKKGLTGEGGYKEYLNDKKPPDDSLGEKFIYVRITAIIIKYGTGWTRSELAFGIQSTANILDPDNRSLNKFVKSLDGYSYDVDLG